ncbi:MAG: molybdate ABC transporter substrate-binding protein [Cyanobacteria bacterium P01_D01_bin.105]
MKRRQLVTSFITSLSLSVLASACSTLGPLTRSGDLPADLPADPSSELSPDAATTTTITVSAAASLQDVLEAIAPSFSAAYPNIVVEYNFGASGALQQQIQQGAPADVFFSAASQQMDALAEKEMILSGSRQNIIANGLVLIAPTTTNLTITNLTQLSNSNTLKSANIKRFAVGEFRSVPAGQYAEQVLKNLNILDSLQSKFVFGNNVRTVLSAVESGNADLGMVYTTDAALSKRVTVIAAAPSSSHAAIDYPAAIVRGTNAPKAAQTFINFLTTEATQQIFEDFGFSRS